MVVGVMRKGVYLLYSWLSGPECRNWSGIAADVIGGTSLMGGRGSIIGAFTGVLIIATLQIGLAQIGVTEPSKRLIREPSSSSQC